MKCKTKDTAQCNVGRGYDGVVAQQSGIERKTAGRLLYGAVVCAPLPDRRNDRDDDQARPDACVVLPFGSESQARHDPTAKRGGNKTQNDAYTNVPELIGQPHV
jgi:hypothetical protein